MGGVQSYFAVEPYVALTANDLSETVMKYYINLASKRLGASIMDASDDFYGAAERLIADQDPAKVPDDEEQEERDGHHNGWQTKRHVERASVAIQLGARGRIYGVDIDTTGFINGAPTTATVECARYHAKGVDMWDTVLDDVAIKPNAHNYFLFRSTDPVYTKARLTVSSGGGVARFRCYGEAVPDWPKRSHRPVNLASAHNGANIICWTDIKQANKPDILIDGGQRAEDGWETPRSRKEPRNDFVVIQLGSPGTLNSIVISTAHFIGNAPQAVSVDGCYSKEENPEYDYGATWHEIQVFTHLRLTIHPDGGIQQFSAYGFPCLENQSTSHSPPPSSPDDDNNHSPESLQPSPSIIHPTSLKKKRQRLAAERATAVIKEANAIVQRKRRRS